VQGAGPDDQGVNRKYVSQLASAQEKTSVRNREGKDSHARRINGAHSSHPH
jgi:hypothetical protein